MNNTATLRERLRTMSRPTFKSSDFHDIPAVSAIITKMARKGELLVVSDIRPKVYKVWKLKGHKPKPSPKAIISRRTKEDVVPLYVQLWSQVYPEFFRAPDFSGCKQTIRRVEQCSA